MSEKHFGVDLSTWQNKVDYKVAVEKGNVEFAMIRAGFGKNVLTQKDNMFETHYAGFRAQNVPLGAYQYSYAKSPADAINEARAMLEWIEGKEFDLPLFLDMEQADVAELGKETCTMIALAWCRYIADAGYKCGIYANPNWFENYLDVDLITERFLIWCASWGTKKPEYKNLVLWQFGGEVNKLTDKAVPGIGDVVDQNMWYGELPVIKKSEKNVFVLRCTKKTSTLDINGYPEARRWIDKGDICEVSLIEVPLIEVTYPTANGNRTAYLKSIENFERV